MTACEAIRPATGEFYRERRTGRIATLRHYGAASVFLMDDAGWVWHLSRDDFWQEWIHSGARP